MTFDEGDLVRVRSASGGPMDTGLVVDVDPSDEAPTFYLISVSGQPPEWYHEDEVFNMPVKVASTV